jgi:hypothetical protein
MFQSRIKAGKPCYKDAHRILPTPDNQVACPLIHL